MHQKQEKIVRKPTYTTKTAVTLPVEVHSIQHGKKTKKARDVRLALAFIAGASSPAFAGSISCPGTVATTDREFTITTSVTASCLDTGTGNISGNGDAINALGYTTLDKSDDSTSGLAPFNRLTITGSGTTSGTFSFVAPPGYTNFVAAFKSGEGRLDPDWAAFLLPAGVVSGTWTISGNQSLSHAGFYGKEITTGTTNTADTTDTTRAQATLNLAPSSFSELRSLDLG